MSGKLCEFCGQPIESVDFYLTFKGGCICPSCVPLARSVQREDRHNFDLLEETAPEDGFPQLPGTDRIAWDALRPMFF